MYSHSRHTRRIYYVYLRREVEDWRILNHTAAAAAPAAIE